MTPGTLIGGKYRLRRPLGDGSMGVVWAAVNELTEKAVALKLLQSQNPELRRRLLREAKACGRLSHRNIVGVYDVGETSAGDPFLVMELLKGETLADRLRRERSLTSTDAVEIAIDVARALQVAHEAGVIHRDLKPANIFLHRSDGDSVDAEVKTRVKVLDFGVSKVAIENESTATATGSVLGSPAYMSPEQARGTSIDGRADLWALGVVLFEMLTGARPFQSRSATGVIAEVLTSPIPTVESKVREIDPALSTVVARCIERDIDRRVKSAAELIGLLRPFMSGREALQSPWDGAPVVVPPPIPEGIEVARTAVLPDAAGGEKTVELTPPMDAQPGATSTSSIAPVSHRSSVSTRRPAMPSGIRGWKIDGKAQFFTIGIAVGLAIATVVLFSARGKHEAAEVPAAAATGVSTEANAAPSSMVPTPEGTASTTSRPELAATSAAAAPSASQLAPTAPIRSPLPPSTKKQRLPPTGMIRNPGF